MSSAAKTSREHLSRGRRVWNHEVDVAETRVVVVVVDVERERSARGIASGSPIRSRSRSQRRREDALGRVGRRFADDISERHEAVLARQRCAGCEVHQDVLAHAAEREGPAASRARPRPGSPAHDRKRRAPSAQTLSPAGHSALKRPVAGVISVVRSELVDELAHRHAVLDGRIVLEGQLWSSFHSPAGARGETGASRVPPQDRRAWRARLRPGAENADVDGRVSQVRCRVDAGDSNEPNAGILELGDGFGENLPDRSFTRRMRSLMRSIQAARTVGRAGAPTAPTPTQGGAAIPPPSLSTLPV